MESKNNELKKPQTFQELLDDMDAEVEFPDFDPRPDIQRMLELLPQSKAPYKCHI